MKGKEQGVTGKWERSRNERTGEQAGGDEVEGADRPDSTRPRWPVPRNSVFKPRAVRTH